LIKGDRRRSKKERQKKRDLIGQVREYRVSDRKRNWRDGGKPLKSVPNHPGSGVIVIVKCWQGAARA